jgi:hypothetical protein
MRKDAARKRRKNPEQEAILQLKDSANQKVSDLIKLLIGAKSGWNGRGSSDLGISPSKLTDPLPSTLDKNISTIKSLTNDIASEYSNIKEKQQEYSEKYQHRISKQASNILTRTWTNVKAPFVADKNRKQRLEILNNLANAEYLMREIESDILSGKKESIYNAATKSIDLFEFIDSELYELDELKSNTISVPVRLPAPREQVPAPEPTVREPNIIMPQPSPTRNVERYDASLVEYSDLIEEVYRMSSSIKALKKRVDTNLPRKMGDNLLSKFQGFNSLLSMIKYKASLNIVEANRDYFRAVEEFQVLKQEVEALLANYEKSKTIVVEEPEDEAEAYDSDFGRWVNRVALNFSWATIKPLKQLFSLHLYYHETKKPPRYFSADSAKTL